MHYRAYVPQSFSGAWNSVCEAYRATSLSELVIIAGERFIDVQEIQRISISIAFAHWIHRDRITPATISPKWKPRAAIFFGSSRAESKGQIYISNSARYCGEGKEISRRYTALRGWRATSCTEGGECELQWVIFSRGDITEDHITLLRCCRRDRISQSSNCRWWNYNEFNVYH